VDRIEGPVLPVGHALHHLVGDRGDGGLGDLGPVDLCQVGGDLAVGQALRGQRQHHLIDAGQAPLPLLDDLRLEGAGHVPRDTDLGRAHVGEYGLGPVPVAAVPRAFAGRIVLVMAEVIGHLPVQGRLQDPLGQLLQQPALAGQLQPLGAGPVHQHLHQLVVSDRLHSRGTLSLLNGLQLDLGLVHLTSLP
jgi:hypothetical protein